MKKAVLISVLCVFAASCTNKKLYYGDSTDTHPVRVAFDWEDGVTQPSKGMRINLFSLDDKPHYGVDDMSCQGGTINLARGGCYLGLCYNYLGNNIYFRNETDSEMVEAYCGSRVRATYTRAFPNETTHDEPDSELFVDKVPSFDVIPSTDELVLLYNPANVLMTYTFEVRNVKGAQFISDTRGAISGMASAYNISTGEPSDVPTTLLFNATADANKEKISGSFRTFGRLDATNNFTIEILFPSSSNGIMQKTWNVTDQIDDNNHFHIVIEDAEIEVPDEGGGSAGGWEVDLNLWNDIAVPLN